MITPDQYPIIRDWAHRVVQEATYVAENSPPNQHNMARAANKIIGAAKNLALMCEYNIARQMTADDLSAGGGPLLDDRPEDTITLTIPIVRAELASVVLALGRLINADGKIPLDGTTDTGEWWYSDLPEAIDCVAETTKEAINNLGSDTKRLPKHKWNIVVDRLRSLADMIESTGLSQR